MTTFAAIRRDQEMTPAEFRAWRQALGLSQARAGEALGLSWRTVTAYEIGEYPIPRAVALATETITRQSGVVTRGA